METIYQAYHIDRYDCKRILLRMKNVSKDRFIMHCKDKGIVTYLGFETYGTQPGYHIEHLNGNEWERIEDTWSSQYMKENVFSLRK